MGETSFTKKVIKDLISIGASVEKVSDRYAVGRADLNITLKGVSIKLESKASEDADYTSIQLLRLVQHNKSGGIGLFIHPGNWEEVLNHLKQLHGVKQCSAYLSIKKISNVQLLALRELKLIKKPQRK